MLNNPRLAASLLLLSACGGISSTSRGYEKPSAASVVSELQERSDLATSFLAESRMEYWVDGERIKTTVFVMGERGAKIRFNALNPTGGDVAADLACNGSRFQFVDFNKNCQLTGPCTKQSIGELLRIRLAPDDFLLLAVGSTPIIDFEAATLHWNPKTAQEELKLNAGQGGRKQKITLDGREKRWDVLSSTVWDAQGNIEWQLTNKGFSAHTSEDKKQLRLPGRTRFEQPKSKADLQIRWDERSVNTPLSADKFEMEVPDLPRCGE